MLLKVKILPVIAMILILSGCSSLSIKQYATLGTVGTLAATKATIEDAQDVKAVVAEVRAVVNGDRETIEKAYYSGVSKIRNEKVRKGMVKLGPKLIDQAVKYAQSHPFVEIRVHVIEIIDGVDDGCDIYIVIKGSG